MKANVTAAIVITLLSLSSGFVDLRVRAYPLRPYQEFIPQVVDGSADAPERYRVLLPLGLNLIATRARLPPATVWHASRLLLFIGAYTIFYLYLRTWFARDGALFGTTLVGATLPLTFTNSWQHPDHIPELLLFTAGCWAIARQRAGWLALLLPVATLNRETAVFLVPLYLFAGPVTAMRVGLTGLFALEWAAVYVGLRIWRGFVQYDYLQLFRNLEFLRLLPANYDPYYRAYAYFGLILFGGLLVIATQSLGGAPLFVRRALWIMPIFAVIAFTISSIIESRIFTPMYALVIPAVTFVAMSADSPRENCDIVDQR
jgi:hypothetical protein